MKFFLSTLALLLPSILGGSAALAQTFATHVDQILEARFAAHEPGASVLIARQGQVIYENSIGMANIELGVAIEEEQVFRIASITKQFTAVAILRLAEEGKINLQDDIRNYIKNFLPADSTRITIENLLSHTAGINSYNRTSDWEAKAFTTDLTPKSLVGLFKNMPLAFEPGTEYRYSNLGYVALGFIIELVSGMPYHEYLQQTFFEPLQMTQTSYDHQEDIIDNRIPGYTKSNDTYYNAEYLDMRLPQAAGGLRSSLGDLQMWYQGLFNGEILKPENLAQAHQAFRLSDGQLAPYGYGWRIGNINGTRSIKHDGIINGFTSIVIYIPEEELFVGMFSNCDCARDIEVPASEITALALDKAYAKTPIQVSSDDLADYHGGYKDDDGQLKLISFQDGTLFYHDKGGSKLELVPVDHGQFKVVDHLEYLQFSDDKQLFELSSTEGSIKFNRIDSDHLVLKSIDLNSNDRQRFLGKYQFPDAFLFELLELEGKMYGQVGNDRHELRPYGENQFFAVTIDARLDFSIDAADRITGLTLIQNRSMSADKVD